jgi:hypothetical protein
MSALIIKVSDKGLTIEVNDALPQPVKDQVYADFNMKGATIPLPGLNKLSITKDDKVELVDMLQNTYQVDNTQILSVEENSNTHNVDPGVTPIADIYGWIKTGLGLP